MIEEMARGASTTGNAPMSKNDYVALKAIVQQAGLLQTQGKYYAIKLSYTLAMFVVGIGLMVLLDGWLRVVVVAPYMAFVSAQLGFLAHDFGHKQVFKASKGNHWAGMLAGNLLVGMGLGWWVEKHNAHHANPNHDDLDPDIDIPFMAFSREQAIRKSGLPRIITAYQKVLFFPFLTFTVYTMQVSSALFTLRKQYRSRVPDAAMLWTHFALYYIGLPLLLGLWQGLAFIVIHRGVLGLLMGSVFAPNHKGMLIIGKNDDKLDFLRKQVLTARNVRSTPFIDFIYGGLNHQAVHHLFPTMPRNKLRRGDEITRQFCAERNIPYHVTGVRQSFREIMETLHDAAAPLRQRPANQF